MALPMAAAFALYCAAAPAAAQKSQGGEEDEAPAYRELIDEAVSEYEAGHFEESRALFSQAHALMPSARTLRGLGMVEFELRNYAASASYAEQALASQARPLDPELRAKTETLLARANRFIGRFTLELDPSSASIAVDGESTDLDAQRTLVLAAGDHTLDVTAPGRAAAHRTLRVRGGERETLHIALPPLAAVAPSAVTLGSESQGQGRAEITADTDTDDGSVFSSPWFWVALSAVVVGGGVAVGIVALGSDDEPAEPYRGDSGILLGGP
jgi:hypothetical protein